MSLYHSCQDSKRNSMEVKQSLTTVESGFTTKHYCKVDDWRAKVSHEDEKAYTDLEDNINHLVDIAGTLSDKDLKLAARAIEKARREQKKIIYKYDFRRFVDDLFSDESEGLQDKAKTPDFHVEMYNAYQQEKRVCVVCPRGHGKSSAARLYILHQILYKRVRYVTILGSSEDMAGQSLRWVRDQLTDNPLILEIFGELKDKKKWSETEFVTKNRIKVTAKGANGKIRGMNEKGRPDLIYIDDIESEENLSKDGKRKLRKWLLEEVMPMRSKSARFIMTGTILDVDSLLKNVALNKFRDHIPWKVLWYQAINKDEKGNEYALWEELKPLNELQKLREIDPQTFAQEYQNNPTSGAMGVFRKEDYIRFDKDKIVVDHNKIVTINGNKLNLLATTDFAATESQSSDYNVIVVSGMDKNGTLFCLDKIRFRSADAYEMADALFLVVKKWNIEEVSIEEIAFQSMLNRTLEREMDRRKLFVYFREMKRKRTTKLARIKGLSAPVRLGKVQWPNSGWEDMEEELDQVTATKLGKHDDILDCLADAWQLQHEYYEDQDEPETPVNTMQWAIDQGVWEGEVDEFLIEEIERRRY